MKKYLLLLCLLTASGLRAQETSKAFTVYFDHDSYGLSANAKAVLDSVVPYAKQLTDVSVSSVGYTDDSGTLDYNKILAADRANAAKDYLEVKGLFVGMTGSRLNDADKPKTPEKQRRAVITVKGNKRPQSVGSGYGAQEFTAPGGTVVIANVENGSEGAITISEYFSPESMIANEMYAIDIDGNMLQTDGMIEICNDGKSLDPDGKTYTVKMPARPGMTINRSMSIWLWVKNDDGKVRWQNTTIEITTDAAQKYYIFKVPAGTQDCVRINLDLPLCGTEDIIASNGKVQDKPVAVYIETYESYNFHTAGVFTSHTYNSPESLPFSAKLNDKLWVFSVADGEDVRNMMFIGKYFENNEEKIIGKPLLRTKYTYNKKDHSHHFFIKDRKRKKGAQQSEKGFWPWIRRQFGSK